MQERELYAKNTIKNVGELAKMGMKETDKTIIRMMTR